MSSLCAGKHYAVRILGRDVGQSHYSIYWIGFNASQIIHRDKITKRHALLFSFHFPFPLLPPSPSPSSRLHRDWF